MKRLTTNVVDCCCVVIKGKVFVGCCFISAVIGSGILDPVGGLFRKRNNSFLVPRP